MYEIHEPTAIERYARLLVNRRIGDMVEVARGERQGTYTKGSVGRYVETYFGLEANSDAEPDFASAGVELKTVPLQRRGRTLSAKERTFITAIDYGTVAVQTFGGSALDLKTRHTLYVFYQWQRDVPIDRFVVCGVLLHPRDDLDEVMLREAHGHVQTMVEQGRAHEMSEGDTWGVGAATKDAGGRWVTQPHSPERVRRRAFAYKPPYTTRLWQLTRLRAAEQAVPADAPDSWDTFARDIAARVRPWIGVSVAELRARFAPELDPAAKNATSVVSRRLLGSDGRRTVEAFDRLGVTIKTVRADSGTFLPHEAVSFPAFDPQDLVTQDWESSDLLNEVSSVYFVVFVSRRGGPVAEATLVGGFFWRPNTDQLAVISREWTIMRDVFAASAPEDRPTASQTVALHVRPHGRDGADVLPLPSGRLFARSSFWLNRPFVGEVIATHLDGHAERRS